jgi:hypothetical protein
MMRISFQRVRPLLFAVAPIFALSACTEDAPLPAAPELAMAAQVTALAAQSDNELQRALATMRRVTAKYHNIDAALADGFVLLHPCEERPDEGPVGTVYIHFERLLDGVIDPASPDALIYEPTSNGRERLVGVEFALPYGMWPHAEPPQYLGNAFQREDEFGVWALHAWTWRHNPEGMFAESNPNVSCGPEAE